MTSPFDRTTVSGRQAISLASLGALPSASPSAPPARPGLRRALPQRPTVRRLHELLFGVAPSAHGEAAPLPHLPDLTSAAISLARGLQHKVLLPLGQSAMELALVRRGDDVFVSHYTTDSSPDVFGLDRPVSLRALLDASAAASADALHRGCDASDAGGEPAASDDEAGSRDLNEEVTRRLAERARTTEVFEVPEQRVSTLRRDPSADESPLAFGFEAQLWQGVSSGSSRSSRADIHALLFQGSLWADVRGRRVPLVQGPIMLAVQRMVVAVRVLVDAFDTGRATHVRLRAGGFQIAVRMSAQRIVTMTLGSEATGPVTVTELELLDACLPILRLASELLRGVVAVDRAQTRNLRVRTLRDEVRALRKAVRTREKATGFVNPDPDRLRASAPPEPPPVRADRPVAPVRSLRMGERWRIAIDGLDAMSTFLCGDRIVLATPSHTVAIGRDQGEVLWVRSGMGVASFMAGRALVRMTPDGAVELCDIRDGEPYATSFIAPHLGDGPSRAFVVGGGAIPQMAVFVEGSGLVALDLATGQARWRFASSDRGHEHEARGGRLRLTRAGRLLLVAETDGTVHALDVATGDAVWCFREQERFDSAPLVSQDTVVITGGALGSQRGALYGLDLYSGERRWTASLGGGPLTSPLVAGSHVLVAREEGDLAERRVSAYALDSGEARWSAQDPGVAAGGACLEVDGKLIVNTPTGAVTALDAASGEQRWALSLADPVADDVPRRLEPVLRGGALFVPAATVHVVRPHDGSVVAGGGTDAAIPCELVPDWLRVDERGWVYVAEESGHVAAYAPVPKLQLVRGGR